MRFDVASSMLVSLPYRLDRHAHRTPALPRLVLPAQRRVLAFLRTVPPREANAW
jgi:hypothetical protein